MFLFSLAEFVAKTSAIVIVNAFSLFPATTEYDLKVWILTTTFQFSPIFRERHDQKQRREDVAALQRRNRPRRYKPSKIEDELQQAICRQKKIELIDQVEGRNYDAYYSTVELSQEPQPPQPHPPHSSILPPRPLRRTAASPSSFSSSRSRSFIPPEAAVAAPPPIAAACPSLD